MNTNLSSYAQKRIETLTKNQKENNQLIITGAPKVSGEPGETITFNYFEEYSGEKEQLKGSIQINYPSLYGWKEQFKDSKHRSRWSKEFHRWRLHPDKTTSDKKYYQEDGSGVHLFYTPSVLEAFKTGNSLNEVYLLEGEFKAHMLWQTFKLPAIGLSGIWGFLDGSEWDKDGNKIKGHKSLHTNLMELFQRCKINRIVFIHDNDCRDIKWDQNASDDTERLKDLTKRPLLFASSVTSLRSLCRPMQIDVVFGHLTEGAHKGIDDVLLDEATNIEEVRSELTAQQGKTHFHFINLVGKSDSAIYKYFGLNSAEEFYELHQDILGNKEFKFKGQMFVKKTESGLELLKQNPKYTKYLPKTAYLPDYNPEADMESFNFFEYENQYMSLEGSDKVGYSPKAYSNFTMRVLYHMNNGVFPKRVIELINNQGKTKIVDITTDKLASKNDFKRFCEGLGNFRFWGNESKFDSIKEKLYNNENECREIHVLGSHYDGFWSWSNGVVLNNQFQPVDENGFVVINDSHYFLPCGNTHISNRQHVYANEIRFRHFIDQTTTYDEWSKRYFEVYGNVGMIIHLFSTTCLYSDIIFNKKNYFPLLFIYGEGGSGKGAAIKSAQRLFGLPQDPLTLSGKANTTKAKIAVFAQFVNSMLLLEEYENNHETDQLLKHLYDRYGYKRRKTDNGYGTENVPIESGVAITGNYSPNDDPLLQRLVYLENNKNQFTPEEKAKFNEFKNYEMKGITSVTNELLCYRNQVEEKYNEYHKKAYKSVSEQCSKISCTDRMLENYSILLAIYDLLTDCGLQFPYKRNDLIVQIEKALEKQNEKRNSGNEAQRFWDIFLHMVNNKIIKHGKEFKIDGNDLFIYYKQIHSLYLQTHRQLYGQSGLSSSVMLDKLKLQPSYKEAKPAIRIGEQITSGHVFDCDKLGVDVISVALYHQEEEKRYTSKD